MPQQQLVVSSRRVHRPSQDPRVSLLHRHSRVLLADQSSLHEQDESSHRTMRISSMILRIRDSDSVPMHRKQHCIMQDQLCLKQQRSRTFRQEGTLVLQLQLSISRQHSISIRLQPIRHSHCQILPMQQLAVLFISIISELFDSRFSEIVSRQIKLASLSGMVQLGNMWEKKMNREQCMSSSLLIRQMQRRLL